MYYPATFTPDTNGTLLAQFRDVPEAAGVGETYEEAYQSALDGLETALFCLYIQQRRPIPQPSDIQAGEQAVYLPITTQAKLALYSEMHTQGISKAELARRLNVNQKQIDRLWDLKHNTKMDFIEQAAAQLGKRFEIAIAP